MTRLRHARLLAAIIILLSGLVPQRIGGLASAEATPHAVAHHLVFHVDSDDPTAMKHAISGSINAARYYAGKGEAIAIEIVANGSGIAMFRTDTSPVKTGLLALAALTPPVVFSVCGSSTQIMESQEHHVLTFVEGVRVVPFGVGRLIELEEAGWTYIHA